MAFALRPEDPSFVGRSQLLARAEVEVAASPDRVWAAVADASAWPSWFIGMQRSRYTSSPPPGVGAKRTVSVGPLTLDETVLVFDPGVCFAFRVDTANLPIFGALVEAITLEATGGGTRLTYQQAAEPAWWLRPFAPLLRPALQYSLTRGVGGLRAWCT